MNKRTVPVSATSGGAQSSGTVREAAAPATVLPQPMTTAVGKGTIAAQDKAGKWCSYVAFGVTSHPDIYMIILPSGTKNSNSPEYLNKIIRKYH